MCVCVCEVYVCWVNFRETGEGRELCVHVLGKL